MMRQSILHTRSHRSGFTLIEVLVSVSIIVLLTGLSLAGILIAKKRANEIRIHSDLALIGTALEAYKSASKEGSYPQFADPSSDQASATANGNGTWLDYSKARGAVLLCRALLGPGPAGTNQLGYAYPGDDGADGPGFRVRRSGGLVQYGQVYPAYLDSSKFKIGYFPATNYPSFPMAYPEILDINGNPILYYPAASGNPASNLSYVDPSNTGLTANVISRFNGFDNEAFLDASDQGTSYATDSPFAVLAAQCGTPPYLLWTAGNDGTFGIVNLKSDDICNFDLPANLKK